MKLSGAERAFIDDRKLVEYCLNPAHPRGRNKARVFSSALGFTESSAPILSAALVEAAKTRDAIPVEKDEHGQRFAIGISDDRPARKRNGPKRLDYSRRRRLSTSRELLYCIKVKPTLHLLDVVALARDWPEKGLTRGQVGTIVEELDGDTFEVEFADDNGRAYAFAALKPSAVIKLHFKPVAATPT